MSKRPSRSRRAEVASRPEAADTLAHECRNHRSPARDPHPRRARPFPHQNPRQSDTPHADRACGAEGRGGSDQPGCVRGRHRPPTGRSAKDKFLVEEPGTEDRIWWEKNARLDPEAFERLQEDVRAHLDSREVFVQDLFAGADPAYRLPVRFITPNAWHALFVRNMFIRAVPAELAQFRPGFTVLHAPDLQADPQRHGTRSSTFIVINFAKKVVLIGGTRYAGEMKKSIFTALNYLLPGQGVMPMHCSANVGPGGDTASSSGFPGPARPRSRPTRPGSSSVMMSTAGVTAACSTSRVAATPR